MEFRLSASPSLRTDNGLRTSPFRRGQVWRSRLDGSEKLQLTFPSKFFGLCAMVARWTTDCFRFVSTGRTDRLCVVGKDGGSPRVLYQGQDIVRPSWRRDANTILFEDNLGVPEEAVVQLFNLKTNQLSTLPGSKGLVLPVVSPNGRYLAAGTVDGKKLKVYDFEAQAWQDFLRSIAWDSRCGRRTVPTFTLIMASARIPPSTAYELLII